MMKKVVWLAVFLSLAASSFAQNMHNKYLFIEGSAESADHYDFFNANFRMEAEGAGYVVTQSRDKAAHTLQFIVFDDPYYDPDYDMEFEQYTIKISLTRNKDSLELVSFDFSFFDITEMYMFNRTLFLNATAGISSSSVAEEGRQWDKWIYFRASFDYPVTFYFLQSTGLERGVALFYTNPVSGKKTNFDPVDHKFMAMPGATLGVECQPLNFLSFEVNFQMNMGDTRNNYFFNAAAGAELKFPVKFKHVMLVPYGAFVYTMNVSPIFSSFPPIAAGGGVQACVRGGKRGIFFIDVKYLYSFGDAVMRNPYLDLPAEQRLSPEPAVIHYKRSQMGIGAGYKFGILDRKKNRT